MRGLSPPSLHWGVQSQRTEQPCPPDPMIPLALALALVLVLALALALDRVLDCWGGGDVRG